MKHAYCILAHNNFKQLQLLVDLLDDERNTIFIHVDKKSYKLYETGGYVKSRFSQIIHVDSLDVRWGDISLLEAEVTLFNEVIKSNDIYDRVHLISGCDLPLHSQDYIHSYFERYPNVEFISFGKNPDLYKHRLNYYHYFVRCVRNNSFANLARRVLVLIQMPFINRLKRSPYRFMYGSEWCSITLGAVKTIVNDYYNNKRIFRFSTCSDECYKQMILGNNELFRCSPLGNLRYIKFSDGAASPEILRLQDLDKIINSKCLFARKFDLNEDYNIIKKITQIISGEVIR